MVAPLHKTLRNMAHWDLFDELHREIGRFFGEPLEQALAGTQDVPVNMAGNEEGLSLSIELPGIARENIDLHIEGRRFTVSAKRMDADKAADTNQADQATYMMRQRRRGDLERTLELPFEIEESGVKATLRDGILHIELPRREASKPRKIEIQG